MRMKVSDLLARPHLCAVAAALSGAAAAAAWAWSCRDNEEDCDRVTANVADWRAAEIVFRRSWGVEHGWDVANWDVPTVHLFLTVHPRLACLRPFKKATWSDVDGEALLAMTGKDFQGKGVPVYASRKIMRCVCDLPSALQAVLVPVPVAFRQQCPRQPWLLATPRTFEVTSAPRRRQTRETALLRVFWHAATSAFYIAQRSTCFFSIRNKNSVSLERLF